MIEPLELLPNAIDPSARLFFHSSAALEMVPKNSVIAEIGVAYGFLSRTLLDKIKPRKFYAIDNFALSPENPMFDCVTVLKDTGLTHKQWYDNQFADQIKSNQMEVIEMQSVDGINLLPDNSLDFAYVDAGHDFTSVINDIKALFSKMKHGGLMQFNDYTLVNPLTLDRDCGVIQAVNLFLRYSSSKIVGYALNQLCLDDIIIKIDKSYFSYFDIDSINHYTPKQI